ncbi:aromatic amino acid hydroxylase [Pseudobacteriovorax antillogorgiicola]|uniref:Phenylalanine-4-hydroxylase n=1 Tax=Pseudobacteriovorax antillogorgiicola TaxID=1513793 RepID=A0A1Y6B824_9BACT|nr:aromatic amino acid hydroxylase [Pseudobacteriovorax antillogorgiicola]TCS58658.1 phenylalanine-4-hydroxylase [Pseudobacteriovorax antillogorgiicola]SME96236.1 phenylalanine-4-hydroxylase [Pseudobacteriovorax antillogorgiicola]
MARTQDQLPQYLRKYCTEHDFDKYTARDHASWRYIMRRAVPFFRQHSVKGYEEGLAATGISLDRIPHIDEIDQALQKISWGAVPVCGFIPPWAFLEFQARKILPIATDMRTVDHIAYTPAPDIVHEAAGHAPILPDVDYNQYLAYYAKLGTKAIYSKQDLQLYEAVRYLSDIKEKYESTPEEIATAERRLQAAVKAFTYVSEAAKVGRMSWWTAEYGMVGSLDAPKIYGAGLLSSVGESKDAMTAKVRKLPLSLDCTNFSFNITEPQPQLFVAENMQHLHDVLHELDDTLSYRLGGQPALIKAIESEAVTTAVLDSGIAISGILGQSIAEDQSPVFLKYQGPVQLSWQESEMDGQGVARHAQGYSSPLGRLKRFPNKPFTKLTLAELEELKLRPGQRTELEYQSGFTVQGTVTELIRKAENLVLVTFTDCRVTRGSEVFFEPEWGEFDLIIGDLVASVYGGPADRESYGEHEIIDAQTSPGRDIPYSAEERQLFEQYQTVRELRQSENRSLKLEKAGALAQAALEHTPQEWLLLLELLELGQDHLGLAPQDQAWLGALQQHLGQPQNFRTDDQSLVKHGLSLLN